MAIATFEYENYIFLFINFMSIIEVLLYYYLFRSKQTFINLPGFNIALYHTRLYSIDHIDLIDCQTDFHSHPIDVNCTPSYWLMFAAFHHVCNVLYPICNSRIHTKCLQYANKQRANWHSRFISSHSKQYFACYSVTRFEIPAARCIWSNHLLIQEKEKITCTQTLCTYIWYYRRKTERKPGDTEKCKNSRSYLLFIRLLRPLPTFIGARETQQQTRLQQWRVVRI